MRFRITFVAIGLLLSFALPRLLRAPGYSTWTIGPSGERNFNLDERDLKAPRWREPEGIVNAVNIPALVVRVPLQLLFWRGGTVPFRDRRFLVWTTILAGAPFWWLFGKFAEQATALVRGTPFEAPAKADWVFAIVSTLSGGLFTCAWFSGPTDLRDLLALAVGGTFWLVVGLCALMIRILQFRGIRKAVRYEAASGTAT